eukprot:1161580-Pelagomonas_calceolata.AAC.7
MSSTTLGDLSKGPLFRFSFTLPFTSASLHRIPLSGARTPQAAAQKESVASVIAYRNWRGAPRSEN